MTGRTLVLSPEHALVAGGPAEHFEFRVQRLFEQGIRHRVVDLRAMPTLDSRGVRALVRGHTTAQRLGGTFKIVRPSRRSSRSSSCLTCTAHSASTTRWKMRAGVTGPGIITGNSLARAFGIAGAASIIRFRTPVEDPKDVTILFLLMGLGMAAGLGAYAVAGLGTGFLCAFLLLLDRMGEPRARLMRVDVCADGREFPTDYVQGVFIRHRVTFETREVALDERMRVRYYASIPPSLSLEDLGAELMAGTAGVKSAAWEPVKE